MSKVKLELCEHILTEYYGEIVGKIGIFLLKNKATPISLIIQRTSLEPNQVKQALCSLIQQNVVTFNQGKSGLVEYSADADAVVQRLRFPHYIHCAKTLFGDAAELLVEELLLQGQSHLGDVITKTTQKLNESIVSSGSSMPEISPSLIKEKVTTLVKARLIRRCENGIKKDGKVVSVHRNVDPEVLFQLPSAPDFEKSEIGSKRTATGSHLVPTKKIKLEAGGTTEANDDETPLSSSAWCVNVHQFHHHFRDQVLISAVARHIDQRASEVMRTMLRLSETRTIPTATESVPLSFTEIFNSLARDKAMSRETLDQYLKCLSDSCYRFVTRVGESSGGMFQINFFKAIKAICLSQVESIVLERFGSKALRMFRVIVAARQIEQKQVEEKAMLPPKEAKELLYKMFAENFVTLAELSKVPDHSPARTFYFYNVNLLLISRMLLEKCYKAATNALVRRNKCVGENKRLLDKKDRVEAIIASLDAEGAADQREEIEQMVTPSERKQLKKVGDAAKTLETSELLLDNTVFIFETFINFTLRPPPPKKQSQ